MPNNSDNFYDNFGLGSAVFFPLNDANLLIIAASRFLIIIEAIFIIVPIDAYLAILNTS